MTSGFCVDLGEEQSEGIMPCLHIGLQNEGR